LRSARLRNVLVALAVVLPAWAALAAWMTVTGRVEPVSAGLWGYGFVLLVQLPLEWSWAQSRLRSRTKLLSRYVARPVLDELLRSEGADPLTPRRADITVLIADMQDYTRMTNDSTLEQAAALTKGFLHQLTMPILENRGTLDRYTGDGLVSFWGAPIADDDHADRALDAASEIVSNVARFNDERAARGEQPVKVRIGVASGSALVGDLGTPFRIAYTAVGDCINLASRLQQASRELDVHVLVSARAAAACRRWRLRSMGTLPVRGLPDEPVFTPAPAPSTDARSASGERPASR
jgi:adenylate cyclase